MNFQEQLSNLDIVAEEDKSEYDFLLIKVLSFCIELKIVFRDPK